MPTGEIGHLKAALSANYAAFESDMSKAKEAVRRNAEGMTHALAKTGKGFDGLMLTVGKFAKVTAILSILTIGLKQVSNAIEFADKLDEIAQSTGTTTEFLSSWTLALKTSGVEMEQFAKSIVRLSRNMKGTGADAADSKNAFDVLGISVRNSDGTLRSVEEVLKDIADRFAALPDGAEKSDLAMRLFGKSGAELIPLLNLGSAGIDKLTAKAESLGLVISTKTARDSAYLKDKWDILKEAGVGLGRSIALAIIPRLADLVKFFEDAAKSGNKLEYVLNGIANCYKNLENSQEAFKARREYEQAQAALDVFGADADPRALEELKKQLAEKKAVYDAIQTEEQKRQKAEEEARRKDLEKQKAEEKQKEQNLKALIKREKALKDAEQKKKAAEDEDKKRRTSIKGIVEGLQDEAATYGMTSHEVKMYTLEKLKATKADKEAAQIAIDETRTKELLAEAERANREERERDAAEAKKLYDETRTPEEKHIARLEKIDDLYAKGEITTDTWMRATLKAFEEIETESEKAEDGFDKLQRAIEGWGEDSAAAIVDFVTGSKGAFTDLVDSIIKDLMRMMVYKNITEPLFYTFSKIPFGSFFTGFFSAKGNAFSGGHLLPFAKGGVVTGPTVFPMATGAGLMGEAGPEAVLPLGRLSSGELGVKTSGEDGGGGTFINITAVDAKSFEDLCKRNPNAIIGPVTKGLKANQQRKQWKGLING